MGPRRSQRARTLKNDAMSANDTHIEKTGRAGDRERQLIREWLAYPKTTFNKKKAAELLLPNIEIWAKLHCSDWKSLEFNVSMIGMILQSAAEDGRLSKHKLKNNRPTQWTCTCGPEPKGKISMDTSTFTSLVNYMKRKVKSFVFGLPIHSHAAERTVNAGSGLVQKGAPHTSQVKLCGLLATILDEVRVFEREARCDY